jgi:hypothetical protein
MDYEDIGYSHNRFRSIFCLFENLVLLGYWDGQYFSPYLSGGHDNQHQYFAFGTVETRRGS